VETLYNLAAGAIRTRPQDNAAATLAPILEKEFGRIDFQRTAFETYNRLRGFQPWPGAFTTFRRRNLNVSAARPIHKELPAGGMFVDGDSLYVGCSGGTSLTLLEVQPEGKKRISARDFVHGYRPQAGERLG
jgi:methionyl-tRNA formyltransferase